jgi:Fe-S-cluster-containing dehydrogenase component/DMSO reductase anchor subunit
MNPGEAAPSFVHDLETCVGCHACVVACANENQLAPGTSWRQVVTFNETRWPGLPVFHLSLACNHCRDAPCLRQCPARAISRDVRTQAVVIDEAACIGCRYCSWVCPYDAPRFDDGRGVMAKCTFCNHRLEVGLDPACVGLCPVGALRLGEHRDDEPRAVAGFSDAGIRPLIRFEPMRRRAGSAPRDTPAGLAAMPAPAEPPRKISLRSEWTLAVFTFVAIVLVGAWTGAWTGGGRVAPAPFLLAGVAAMVLSTFHLGRPERAWRAALNLRTSWLSREVLSYSAFLGAAALVVAGAPGGGVLAAAATAAGVVCLVCVDRVYASMARTSSVAADHVEAVSSGLFLTGVFAGNPMVFLPLGAVRVWALAVRMRAKARAAEPRAFAPLRIVAGWLVPLGIWLGGWQGGVPLAVALVIAGEAWDRATFYQALEIVTPRLQMARDLALAKTSCPPSGGLTSVRT